MLGGQMRCSSARPKGKSRRPVARGGRGGRRPAKRSGRRIGRGGSSGGRGRGVAARLPGPQGCSQCGKSEGHSAARAEAAGRPRRRRQGPRRPRQPRGREAGLRSRGRADGWPGGRATEAGGWGGEALGGRGGCARPPSDRGRPRSRRARSRPRKQSQWPTRGKSRRRGGL